MEQRNATRTEVLEAIEFGDREPARNERLCSGATFPSIENGVERITGRSKWHRW